MHLLHRGQVSCQMKRLSDDSHRSKRVSGSRSYDVLVLLNHVKLSGGRVTDSDSYMWRIRGASEEVYQALEYWTRPDQGVDVFRFPVEGVPGAEECIRGMFEGGWVKYLQHGLSADIDRTTDGFILHGATPKCISCCRLTKPAYLPHTIDSDTDRLGAVLYFGNVHWKKSSPTGGEIYAVPAPHMPPGFHKFLEFESRLCLDKSDRDCPTELLDHGEFYDTVISGRGFHPWTPFILETNRRFHSDFKSRFYSLLSS
jgi:hypothetical protein